ncbi:MAG: hypothetical protein ACI9FR_000275 [Cryomorphaceae bacterium]|jgi:hypothetical protein
MSTILEALRKSEQDRKLNSIPTLSDMLAPKEPNQWPMLAVLISVIFLLIMLLLIFGRQWLDYGNETAQVVTISNQSLAAANTNPATAGDQELTVNVVSFSEVPNQSFTMINGKLYRQGEFVRAGLKVEKIETDRVILNLRGRRIIRTP